MPAAVLRSAYRFDPIFTRMADIVVVVVMSSFVPNKVNTIKQSVSYLLSVLV